MEESASKPRLRERVPAGSGLEDLEEGVPSAPTFEDFYPDAIQPPGLEKPEDQDLASAPPATPAVNALSDPRSPAVVPHYAPRSHKPPQAPSPDTGGVSAPSQQQHYSDADSVRDSPYHSVMPSDALVGVDSASDEPVNAAANVLADAASAPPPDEQCSYKGLSDDLHKMDPHFYLSKELERMHMDDDQNVMAEGASAPPVSEPEVPSAPAFDVGDERQPGLEDLSHAAKNYGERIYEVDQHAIQEQYTDPKQSMAFPAADHLTPFTDSQLHALYHSVELEKNYEFVAHWLDTQKRVERLELDELLTNYQRVRLNLISTTKQYHNLKESAQALEKQVWILSKEKVEEEGECEDGREVLAVKERSIAEFNSEAAQALRIQLKQSRELLEENYSLYNFRTELARLKVEEFIHVVLDRCLNGGGTSSCGGQATTPPGTVESSPARVASTEVYTPQEELRLTVSVLFKFMRKDLNDDKLSRDIRIWLDRTVAVVLSQATLYDHLFLLNHIMRCPAGAGKWTACYIQPAIPITDPAETSFDNPYLDHMMTILATILLPVRERAAFLQEFKIKAKTLKEEMSAGGEPKDNIWTVLDNEGSEEEDPGESWAELREMDLVALLDQIPIDHMFRYILRIEERDEKEHYDISLSNPMSMLKLYAFSTQLVYLLREGLKTFNTPKYRQFAKRLGRLIRHTVHYVSDHWEYFKMSNAKHVDSGMYARLQLEYDHFFLRATKCIFNSLKLGIWQYLADIPYGTISPHMLWRIFHVLHLDYNEEYHQDFEREGETDPEKWQEIISSPDVRIQFEEKCATAEESQLYFLMSAFANMAKSRGEREKEFIKQVALDIFYIGFVSESTRETSCKNCRDLLSDLCSTHPFVISFVLEVMQPRTSDIGKLCGYLLLKLPWDAWRPTAQDMELTFQWLHSPPNTIENHLARTILSNMNWSFGVLPTQLHIDTCIKVVEEYLFHFPDPAGFSMGYNSIHMMTNLAMTTVTSLLTPDQQFTKWSWEMLSRVHVHSLDMDKTAFDGILAGNGAFFAKLIDFDLSPVVEGLVSAAVSKQPLACFAILSLTQVGHSLPEICERGLAFIRAILDCGRMDHVLEILLHVVPIFLNDKSAVENEQLSGIISKLLQADQSYLSIAKSIITRSFPGPVTKEFGNMVEKSLQRMANSDVYSVKDLILLWLKIICRESNWNTNSSALYIVDLLCRHSFSDPECYQATLEFFEDLHKSLNKGGHEGGLFGMLSRLGGSGHQFILSSSNSTFIWLAFFILEAEDSFFRKSGFWRYFVLELSEGKSLESALVCASKTADIVAPGSGNLMIYRWAQQAMDTPADHPILYMFWQKFFALFLSRPPGLQDGAEQKGIGMIFFDGIMNMMYLSKVKNSIKIASEALANANRESKESVPLNIAMEKLFKAFQLWIEEAKVLDSTLYVPALATTYEPAKLVELLSGNINIWWEYFDSLTTKFKCLELANEWDTLHFRKIHDELKNSPSRTQLTSPKDRITSRLQGYEARLPAPPLRSLAQPVPDMIALNSVSAVKSALQGPLTLLNDYSQSHANNISAFGSLNCTYLELLPSLWSDEEITCYLTVACKGAIVNKEKVDCCGPALIPVTFEESKKSENTAAKIELNRKDLVDMESRILATTPSKYIVAAVMVNNALQNILKAYEKDLGKGKPSKNFDLACQMFELLAKSVGESWLSVPALRHFMSTCLDNLGSVLVNQWPCMPIVILDILKESPFLSAVLTPHFVPKDMHGRQYLTLYSKISSLPNGDGSLPFALLTKLDIGRWLLTTPAKEEISNVICLVFQNLEKSGIEPEPGRHLVHGLHKRHVCTLLCDNYPENISSILSYLLRLSGNAQIDPHLWYDILNVVMQKYSVAESQPMENNFLSLKQFAKENCLDMNALLATISQVYSYFTKERNEFGLYGLFPKYRSYVKPLSLFLAFLSSQLVVGQLNLNNGFFNKQGLDFVWKNMLTLFDTWILPFKPSPKAGTANWIQQLSNEENALQPWIPGDSALAVYMIDAFSKTLQLIMEYQCDTNVLSHLLNLYANTYANQSTKDHVYGVIHPAFVSLNWSCFKPTPQDIEAMLKISKMFLPQSHSFLGTIFVQIDWETTLDELTAKPDFSDWKIFPAVLSLLVKLSNEPSVRQSGRLLGIVTQAEKWDWQPVDSVHYEALAQWFVMSVDARCIIKHKDRSLLDTAVLRLLYSAAEFENDANSPNIVKKQQIWVKCCVKLLGAVGSKQKNFLSHNQPALHTSLRKILEDIEDVALNGSHEACPVMVKDFLTLFNTSSNTVLPGSTMVVTQSWLSKSHRSSPLITSLLSNAGIQVKEVKYASQLLEAGLDAFFKDDSEPQTDESGAANAPPPQPPSWNQIKSLIQWPSGTKIKELLDEAVKCGHCLLLHAYFDLKQQGCLSSQEEMVLATTLLDYLRHIANSYTSSAIMLGIEPKLALIYRKLVRMFQRLAAYSSPADSAKTVSLIGQLADVLLLLAESTPGWGQNILGAIGLGSSNVLTVRGKFLSRSLALFLFSLITKDRTALAENTLNLDKKDSSDQSEPNVKKEALASPELKAQLEKLNSLKSNKGFTALHDLLNWVLAQVEDPSNKLCEAHLFIDHLVVDKLYTEIYLRFQPQE